ncbi:MAG TPA: SGNH/GDSL hydrolase family protein [Planctomycetaceae bacterium]|nr:SGNH/GDSL hydrolase family protein [Planctomycetaceae bacterium]
MTETAPTADRPPGLRARRLMVLAILGTSFVGGGILYRHYWFTRPIGSGPAGPKVPAEPFREIWSERPVLLVGIGDSITAGFGATSKHGYFDRLVANPDDEFPDMQGRCLSRVLPNLKVRNLALSGSNSIECLEILVPRLEPQDPETFGIIVMTVGGNDLIHDYGRTPPRDGAMYGATFFEAFPMVANIHARLTKIVDRIEEKFPGGCQFFITNVYDPTDKMGDVFNAGLPPWPDGLDVLEAHNENITTLVHRRPNLHLIDMHRAFLGHGIHCRQFWRPYYDADDPHYWYWENLEDPNDRGYDALRRLFLLEMIRVLPPLLKQ